jgi:MinD-like ATPase involved in chromosome partitioning or flagellar assembly
MSLCNKHGIDLDIASYLEEFEIYKAMVDKGISESEIVTTFSMALNLPFYDVAQEELSLEDVNQDKIEDLVDHIKVFPFRKDGELRVAVSTPEQMEYAENIMATNDYMFCFSFQFLIDMRLEDLDLSNLNVVSDIDHAEKALSTVNNDRKTIMLASGQDEIDEIIEQSTLFNETYITIAKIYNRNLLIEYCENDAPDILLIGDNIGGKSSLTEILLKIKMSFPETRIIYLAGEVDPKDNTRKLTLGTMVAAGIYDIITKNDLSVVYLKDILDNPTQPNDVKHFLEYVKDGAVKKKNTITIFVPDVVETDNSVTIYDNLYSFTSPKGGVGKTFIIEQVAIAIATCGVQRTNGTKPRVGIIDLDFEGFGVSNFFGTLNSKDNIFVATEEARKIINKLGEQKDVSDSTAKYVNERIRQMFRTSTKFSNIKVLGGTDKYYHTGDKSILDKYLLTFIVETVLDDFDVLLIDINTDMDTSIVYPLYSLSNNTYFVLDMNWNTFHNNKRYLMHLESKDMYIPEQSKFILNKAIYDENLYVGFRDIEAGLGITFSNIFPMINPVTMFNFSCKSDNIIQHGGDELAEEKYYFLRLANEMYPIMNFDILSANFEGKTKIKISKEALKESEENKHKVDAKKGIFVDSKDSKKKMFDIKNMFSFIKTKKQKKSNDDTNTDNGEA